MASVLARPLLARPLLTQLLATGLVLTALVLAGVTTEPSAAHAAALRAATTCGPTGISHRGIGAGAPESTLPGFRGVARMGVRVLESDVRFTRDQVPVIMHDATVDRTTDGTGRVDEMTYRQVARLDAGGGTRVPRLRGLVALAARRHVRLLAELKPPGTTERQVRRVVRIVRSGGMGRRTTIHSREAANLRRVHRVAPRMRTMLVLGPDAGFRQPAAAVDTVGAHHSLVTRHRVRRWHRGGVRVYAWTVDRAAGWRRLDVAGADGVVTNRPRAFLRWQRRGCR